MMFKTGKISREQLFKSKSIKGKKKDIETKEYPLVTPKDLNNIPNLVQKIEEQQPL